MTVYGENAHPAVIVHSTNSALFEWASRYAQTIRSFGGPIRWLDWDVLITDIHQSFPWEETGLRIVQIGGQPSGEVTTSDGAIEALYLTDRPGSALHVPETLPEEVREFVKRRLVPCLDVSKLERQIVHCRRPVSSDKWIPLLTNADGDPIALLYKPEEAREVWYFPEEASDVMDAFLSVAFERWHGEEPSRFPGTPDWTENPEWMTATQQIRFTETMKDIAESRAQILQLEEAIAAGEVMIETVHSEAKTSHQRLMTSTGDELVSAVISALRTFEFDVVNLDDTIPEGQPKLGDLKVTDDERKIMAEVKGYSKGAKANDLLAIGNHRRVYEKTHGDLDGVWYIANTFLKTDPGVRAPALGSSQDQVDVFGEGGGLVVDSRDLFQLVKRVELGEISAKDARQQLMNATGRFAILEKLESEHAG